MSSKDIAIKFFKRNPTAKVAHVVLDGVTDDIKKATAYQKAISAKKVSTWLRSECEPLPTSPEGEATIGTDLKSEDDDSAEK